MTNSLIFGNPVRGPIHPSSWKRPSGNLDFRLTQPFGCTGYGGELPYGNCAHFHRGIDLGNGGHCGADVLAVAGGIVTLDKIDVYSGNAIRVWLKHPGGWYSGYYHLQNEIVSVGQSIAKGQLIGHVGDTGWADGCHLHFECHATSDHLSFFDPWPHLEQNITVHPAHDGVNIRSTAGSGSTPGPLYASTKPDGHIYRTDGADIGLTTSAYKWGGQVTGAEYTVGGVKGTSWERMWLGGAYRYVASPLAIRSI